MNIIDSIKNQQELELLRTVYRESLYVVGVFAPVAAREASLRSQGLLPAEIAVLMDRDSGEELDEGQTVEETFPQCDFFLRTDSSTETQLRGRVERFLHLILGTQVITPTRAETAMYAAASAAGNSACLSRQVGAAVTDADGEVVTAIRMLFLANGRCRTRKQQGLCVKTLHAAMTARRDEFF